MLYTPFNYLCICYYYYFENYIPLNYVLNYSPEMIRLKSESWLIGFKKKTTKVEALFFTLF